MNKIKKNKKIVVVVGGSGQLGHSTINVLLKLNYYVINLDLVNINKTNNKYFFFKTDITNEADVKSVTNKIKNKFKKINILINHSQYKGGSKNLNNKSLFFSKLDNYPSTEWQNTIDVNLNGLFFTTKYFLPLLLRNKSSVILNTSSAYGKVSPNKSIYSDSGINSPVSYATTKFGIIGFTKYMATHYADKGLRANVLIPGGIENKKHTKKFKKNYSKLTPLGRMSKTKDYTDAILYLISDSSSYMTGSEFVVDGGWTAW